LGTPLLYNSFKHSFFPGAAVMPTLPGYEGGFVLARGFVALVLLHFIG
jgi:hypothetical protein